MYRIIIVGLAALLCLALVILESKGSPTDAEGILWLQYGVSTKVIGIFAVGTTGYAVINSLLAGRPLQAAILGALIGLCGFPVFLTAFFWKVGFDHKGIYSQSPWRRNRFVPWSDVRRVRFSQNMKQWIIETRCQGNIRINELVPGASDIVSLFNQRGICH